MSCTTGFTQLTHQAVLQVQGKDAKQFLQGQLTCNLNYLNNNQSSLGARCNAKGRMQSSFRIVQQDDSYLLAMHASVLEAQVQELKKYAVFSKVELTDISEHWVRFGLMNADSALNELGIELANSSNSVTLHEQMLAIRVNTKLSELWLPASAAGCTLKRLENLLPQLPLNCWLLAMIESGIAEVSQANFESFIPQMLNLPALGGVSFKKGCYTGQEIVARMQYLGKLKRRTYRLSADTQQLPEIGSPIFAYGQEKAVGEVVLAANNGQHIELLAVITEQAANESSLHLASANGASLTELPLPYQLDVEQEIKH